jgi:hypothetical protein
MTTTSCFWAFVEQAGHRLSCHHRYFLVIACTLVCSLQQLMLHQQIAALLFSIIQGKNSFSHISDLFSHHKCLTLSHAFCRASPCEFVIPLSKYVKAVYHTRISVGMRFRMLFETEESSVRRYVKPMVRSHHLLCGHYFGFYPLILISLSSSVDMSLDAFCIRLCVLVHCLYMSI